MAVLSLKARSARRKFLHYFEDGFRDETYLAWERDFKWKAHKAWQSVLAKPLFAQMLEEGRFSEAALSAVRVESRTMLLFSFEKMALRDAVADPNGARAFSEGLYAWLYGPGSEKHKFERWCEVVAQLPRRQTRVATWPVITVFGFIARPNVHMYLKPTVTKRGAEAYGYDLTYRSRPGWDTYSDVLDFAGCVKRDVADLKPRDMIDTQSFIWVQGSDEYP